MKMIKKVLLCLCGLSFSVFANPPAPPEPIEKQAPRKPDVENHVQREKSTSEEMGADSEEELFPYYR